MENKELQVALVQTDLVWENPDANRWALERKINGIPTKIDLVVLPEMFTTGFTMHPEHLAMEEGKKTLDWMMSLAKAKNTAITGSTVFYDEGNYYNRLFFVTPDADVFSYDKRHTFTLAGEDKVYQAGAERKIISYKGFIFCPLICYDLRFPVWSRNTEAFDVLLYVANWPKTRIAAWDTLLCARAIENMAYCIGVNRVGIDAVGHQYPGHSAVYDPLGQKMVLSKKEEIVYTALNKDALATVREKLRFLEDRDDFNLV